MGRGRSFVLRSTDPGSNRFGLPSPRETAIASAALSHSESARSAANAIPWSDRSRVVTPT